MGQKQGPTARKLEGRLLLFSPLSGIYLLLLLFLQHIVSLFSQSFYCIHRTEQVYRFFQKWCPNIHNALDDDESEDDEMVDPHCCTAEEEVNRVISLFHSSSWFQMNRGGWVSGLIAVGKGRPHPKLSPTP